MRTVIGIIVVTQLSFSVTVGLEALLENAQQPQQIKQMIEDEFNALESKTLADIQTAPLTFNHALSRSSSPNQSEFEYEIGMSKEFKLGNIQALEEKENRLNHEAQSIEQGKVLVAIANRLKNDYHQYCLDQAYSGSFQEKFERFSLLYHKKRKAYEEDEISRTELVQIELEKNSLENELNSFIQQVEDEKQGLLRLTSFSNEQSISCQDTYPFNRDFESENSNFPLTQSAYEKRIKSTQIALKRQSKKFETIQLSTGYLRELERDVYTIGVSIPLNLSSRKSEYERASLLHHSSALSVQNEHFLVKRNHEINRLKAELTRAYQSIINQEASIQDFKNRLLPLMQKSYEYGESSVVEYLLSQQQLSLKESALLEHKKGYYQTLFTLYNISEKR